jgi:hypothetical protein
MYETLIIKFRGVDRIWITYVYRTEGTCARFSSKQNYNFGIKVLYSVYTLSVVLQLVVWLSTD